MLAPYLPVPHNPGGGFSAEDEKKMSFTVKIYHNPACGTSRNSLAAIREAGIEPEVIEYLKTGWTEKTLREILREMGAGARDILRDRGTPAAELGLLEAGVSDDAIIAAMVKHPILVNRPIVRTKLGTVLARPMEKLHEVLPEN
jgi:arsenate reductase